jgi:hypothetical protein
MAALDWNRMMKRITMSRHQTPPPASLCQLLLPASCSMAVTPSWLPPSTSCAGANKSVCFGCCINSACPLLGLKNFRFFTCPSLHFSECSHDACSAYTPRTFFQLRILSSARGSISKTCSSLAFLIMCPPASSLPLLPRTPHVALLLFTSSLAQS